MNKADIKDPVIKSHLENFIRDLGYENLDLSKDNNLTRIFERFVNHLILSQIYHKEITKQFVESVSTGDAIEGSDCAIDGLIILIDGNLILCKDDLSSVDLNRKGLEVRFNFIQAKTSARFDKGDINNFMTEVKLFFDPTQASRSSTTIRKLKQLAEHIFELTNDNVEVSFTCQLYYVTTGIWNKNDNELGAITNERKLDIERLGYFPKEGIVFEGVGAEQIKQHVKAMRLKISRSICFKYHIKLPIDKNERVQKAYIGIISGDEYLKLICNKDGNLQRMIFERNVRDYQGSNTVNIEITNAVNDVELNSMFALLNNGITIVAKSVTSRGQEVFIIEDYQIVNGCQTSHVLYNNKDKITSGTWIPIKLIATKDDLVTNAITKATNNQTEIDKLDFESSKPFHAQLEEYYSAYPVQNEQKIYFERRRGQYSDYNISMDQIITIEEQAKSYIAMKYDEPHSAFLTIWNQRKSKEDGKVEEEGKSKDYRKMIFQDSDVLSEYYLSGYAQYTVRKLFNSKRLGDELFNFRYHAIWMFKAKYGSRSKKNKADDCSKKLLSMLLDQGQGQAEFIQIASELKNYIEEYISLQSDSDSSSNIFRQKDFTDWLSEKAAYCEIKDFRAIKQNDVVPEIPTQDLSSKLHLTGKIEHYDYSKCSGYIKCDDNGASYFFVLSRSSPLISKMQVDHPVKFILEDKGLLRKVRIIDE